MFKTDGKTLDKNVILGTDFNGLTDELIRKRRYSCEYNTQFEEPMPFQAINLKKELKIYGGA